MKESSRGHEYLIFDLWGSFQGGNFMEMGSWLFTAKLVYYTTATANIFILITSSEITDYEFIAFNYKKGKPRETWNI